MDAGNARAQDQIPDARLEEFLERLSQRRRGLAFVLATRVDR